MKAIIIHQYGSDLELQLSDQPMPVVGEDEVLVKVYAAGVNPSDWRMRVGRFAEIYPHTFPLILGNDISGVVEQVGSRVTKFKVGDAVFGLTGLDELGGYAEYISINEKNLSHKPNALSFVEAASIPMVSLTAWQSLIDRGSLKAGDRVLIHAGAGGVGSFAIQLAKVIGAYVITTARKPNHTFVESLGADEIIDYQSEDFTKIVSDVDIVLDTIGGEVMTNSFKVLKPGGKLISIVSGPISPEIQKKAEEYHVHAEFVSHLPRGDQLDQIGSYYQDGKIKTVVQRTFSLSEVRKAHQLIETGHSRGKIVLDLKSD